MRRRFCYNGYSCGPPDDGFQLGPLLQHRITVACLAVEGFPLARSRRQPTRERLY